jgi:hypothetical protein
MLQEDISELAEAISLSVHYILFALEENACRSQYGAQPSLI